MSVLLALETCRLWQLNPGDCSRLFGPVDNERCDLRRHIDDTRHTQTARNPAHPPSGRLPGPLPEAIAPDVATIRGLQRL